MTSIPPGWLGSIIQTQGAQERAGQAKNVENAQEAKGAERGEFSDKLKDVIGNSDRDTEVYADAEGTGSQGKPFSESEEEKLEEDEARDESAGSGLDIEA